MKAVRSLLVAVAACQLASPASAATDAANPPSLIAADAPRIPSTTTPGVLPTDATPYTLRGGKVFTPGLRYRIYQRLPERLFFNATAEVSQRLDTNVFFTNSNRKADYVFRVLPNITLGYNVFGNTSLYTNYFVIKDEFADNTILNKPTTQSLSMGLRQDFPIKNKANIQFDVQARELWQSRGLRQADLLPALNVQYYLTPKTIVFASALLQMRSQELFLGATRELDPFFSWGLVKRFGQWTFVASDTLVLNYRQPTFRHSIPPQSNKSMIASFELSHPVHARLIPGLDGFVRVEPVFNWGAPNGTPGLSGTDVRVMGGLRYNINKPSYAGHIRRLRKQLSQAESKTNPVTTFNGGSNSPNSPNNSGPGAITQSFVALSDDSPQASTVAGMPSSKMEGVEPSTNSRTAGGAAATVKIGQETATLR